MRKTVCIVLLIVILIFAVGCSKPGFGSTSDENPKIYTYEELAALPDDQLLDLFVENGLEINERLKEYLTEEELQEYFKLEFGLLHLGATARSDIMYIDLAKKTKVIYEELTGQE